MYWLPILEYFSDTNYVLSGFRAEYFTYPCPHNCSNNGICDETTGQCHCHALYGGAACSVPLCPDSCGNTPNKANVRGHCSTLDDSTHINHKENLTDLRTNRAHCVCRAGFAGDDCSLDDNNFVGNTWHFLARPQYSTNSSKETPFLSRTSHASVYDPDTDLLYIYGGFNLNYILEDLIAYDFKKGGSWLQYDNKLEKFVSSSFQSRARHEREMASNSLNSPQTVVTQEKNSVEGKIPAPDSSISPSPMPTPYEDINDIRPKTQVNKEKALLNYPPPLYGHAMSKVPGGFVVFGGIAPKENASNHDGNGTTVNDLWFFNTTSHRWSIVATESKVKPVPVSKHTLTRAQGYLYSFGGSEEYGKFSHAMYKIFCGHDSQPIQKGVIPTLDQWELVEPMGGNTFALRVTGHSMVYHEADNKLVLFGGIRADAARFSKLSGLMYAFDISSESWSDIDFELRDIRKKDRKDPNHLSTSSISNIPPERAFHSANIMGNYMVVFGGYSHRHNDVEHCHDDNLYFFHLGCYVWVNDQILKHSQKASDRFAYPLGVGQGLFGHSTAVRKKNFLVITGGYNGAVSNAAMAYTFPYALAMANNSKVCTHYGSQSSCSSNPECGWCPTDGMCYLRTSTSSCSQSNLQTTACEGICSKISNCRSCASQAAIDHNVTTNKMLQHKSDIHEYFHGATMHKSAFNVIDTLNLRECSWCSSQGKCYPKHGISDFCGVADYASQTPTNNQFPFTHNGMQNNYTKFTSFGECIMEDHTNGLTLTEYYHPVNLDYPDNIQIVNKSEILLPPMDKIFVDGFYSPDVIGSELAFGQYVSLLRGFITVPKSAVSNGRINNTMHLCVENVQGIKVELFLSRTRDDPMMKISPNLNRVTSRLPQCGKSLKWSNSALDKISIHQKSSGDANVVLSVYDKVIEKGNISKDIIMLKPGDEYKLELRVTRNISLSKNSNSWSKISLVRKLNDLEKDISPFDPRLGNVLPNIYLKPYEHELGENKTITCDQLYKNCMACTSSNHCVWDGDQQFCAEKSIFYPTQKAQHLKLHPSECVSCEKHIYCDMCIEQKDGGCDWIEDLQKDESRCVRKGRFSSKSFSTSSPTKVIKNVAECPAPCHQRQTCASCVGDAGKCVWCQGTQECFLFSVYTSHYMYGRCSKWIDKDRSFTPSLDNLVYELSKRENTKDGIEHSHSQYNNLGTKEKNDTSIMVKRSALSVLRSALLHSAASVCVECRMFNNCSTCLTSLNCGWCYDSDNPTLGRCIEGGFDKPINLTKCPTFPTENETGDLKERKWAYSQCPDINECELGLHSCHPDAVCMNKDPGTFGCKCKKGFIGDGYQFIGVPNEPKRDLPELNTSATDLNNKSLSNHHRGCHRTCFEDCLMGKCSEGPDYSCICELGWWGADCSNDCGCNGHSTCMGIKLNDNNDTEITKLHTGECDKCHHNTVGDHCQFCVNGSHGNATSGENGCKPCNCNDHGDVSKGICNKDSGSCFCDEDTEGPNCEYCKDGFFGNPKNGKSCYRVCKAKQLIQLSPNGVTRGYLGLESSKTKEMLGTRKKMKIDITTAKNEDSRSNSNGKTLEPRQDHVECLWIITSINLTTKVDSIDISLMNFSSSVKTSYTPIHLTIESLSPNIGCSGSNWTPDCDENTIYVYDGLPNFLSGSSYSDAKLLAVISQKTNGSRLKVEAKLGVMTVHYVGYGIRRGFKAHYDTPRYSNPSENERDAKYTDKKSQSKGGDYTISKDIGVTALSDLDVESLEGNKFKRKNKNSKAALFRFGHSIEMDKDSGILWVFGGYSNIFAEPLNDIRAFDTRKGKWIPITIEVSSASLAQRRKKNPHIMKQTGFDVQQVKEKRSRKTRLIQHSHQEQNSGRRNKRWLDRFARFSLLSSSFDSQPARPTLLGPPPRYFHASSFVLNEKTLYIQGGMNKTDYLGDFWSFDVLHRTWQRLPTFHNSRCCDENSNPLVETKVNIVLNNLKIWNTKK